MFSIFKMSNLKFHIKQKFQKLVIINIDIKNGIKAVVLIR